MLGVQSIQPARGVQTGCLVPFELSLPMLLAQLLVAGQRLRVSLRTKDDLPPAQHIVSAVGRYSRRIRLQGEIGAVNAPGESTGANARCGGWLRSRHGNSFPQRRAGMGFAVPGTGGEPYGSAASARAQPGPGSAEALGIARLRIGTGVARLVLGQPG